jgi:transposase
MRAVQRFCASSCGAARWWGSSQHCRAAWVGLEACATAHYWARELQALGHEVRLMPAQYIKPYVKRGKNDAIDAQAICGAMSRPGMHFVPVKSRDEQAALMLLKVRDLLMKQRTMLTNAISRSSGASKRNE